MHSGKTSSETGDLHVSLTPLPDLLMVFGAANAVLFFAVVIGFSLKGPVRWVKMATLLLLVDFGVGLGAHVGWEAGLRFVGITAAATFGSVAVALHSWRHPVQKRFEPATPDACPKHARPSLERWTRELGTLGFATHAEHKTFWKIQGQPRLTFVRFFRHHSEPLWVEIHALENPKIVARMITSDKGEGRAVFTCDQQADQEFFRDPSSRLQRLPRNSSCAEMIEQHRRLALTSEGTSNRVEDPVEGHVSLYDGWVERLLASNQVRRVEPGWIGIKRSAIPGMVLRTWAAWFH